MASRTTSQTIVVEVKLVKPDGQDFSEWIEEVRVVTILYEDSSPVIYEMRYSCFTISRTVAVARRKNHLYVYDPAFKPDTPTGLRIGDLTGIRMIKHLREAMNNDKGRWVATVYIKGTGDEELNCLKEACLWLYRIANGEEIGDVSEWYELKN